MPSPVDEARAKQIAINYFKLSDADRAQFEKAFWKVYAIPDPKASVLPEQPSREWFLAHPQTLEKSEPRYLCTVCQHVDFKFLVNSPLEQVLEEFTLFHLKWVVQKGEMCCFCRLILKTIKDVFGGWGLVTEVEEMMSCVNIGRCPWRSISQVGVRFVCCFNHNLRGLMGA